MAAVTNYVITPLSFLSGTFYSVKDLPEFWYVVSKFNPFFYMIDGFRYGLTGYHDGSLEVGILVMSGTTLLIGIAVHRLFASGYRLKH
jgi:ABC-2 type transport system permease protein